MREAVLNFINYIVAGAVIITFAEAYLKVNKIWKRRGEKEVAAAQSFFGLGLSFVTSTLWVLKYFLENNYSGAAEYSIFLAEAFVFILIGTGLFVKGNREIGLMRLIRQALRLERKEADYLLKKIFKPQNANEIIGILYQLAVIDGEFDEKERDLIETFAREWSIDLDFEALDKFMPSSKDKAYIMLRKSVVDYLDSEPAPEQASVFKDMMSAIVNADSKITDEEALISDELITMTENYIKSDSDHRYFRVIIVPQDARQDALINEIMPDAERVVVPGGYVYLAGSFYSKKYSEMICRRHRQSDLLTVVLDPEEFENAVSGR